MNQKELQDVLADVGLTPNEASVYLAGIQLGPTTIAKLSQATDIKRPTVYTIFESLIKKGLAYVSQEKLKKEYVCHSPENLKALIAQRQQRFEDKIPDFLRLYNARSEDHLIEHYRGAQEIQHMYLNLIESLGRGEPYYVIGNQEAWYFSDERFWQRFIEKRSRLGLDLKLLLQDSNITRVHKKYEANYAEKVKILPQEVALATNTIITPRRVIIHSLETPSFAMVINDANIAASQMQTFELMWASL